MSSPVFPTNTNQKEVIWQQYRLCLAVEEYQILGGKHFRIFGRESGKIRWLKKARKSTTANEPSCVVKSQLDFP